MKNWIAPALLTPFAALALARLIAHDAVLPLAWLNALTPWIYLPVWPLLAYALYAKRPGFAGAAAFVAGCHLAWVSPSVIASRPIPGPADPRLRVATANLLYVNDRPRALARELSEIDADVLVLEEVSPLWLSELAPLLERYPYHEIVVRQDAFGIALASRYPIVEGATVDLFGVPMMDYAIEVEGRQVRITGVHTLPPVDPQYFAVWRNQMKDLAVRAATSPSPMILLGDLNATAHAAGFRELERAGLRDVHEVLGRGLATTWPNGIFEHMPSLHLDHVLVSDGIVPLAVREGIGAGSDHRPVIVDVAVTERQPGSHWHPSWAPQDPAVWNAEHPSSRPSQPRLVLMQPSCPSHVAKSRSEQSIA